MGVLLLSNCKQLATVHVSIPPPAEAAAAALAAAGGVAGRSQQRAASEGGSSRSQGHRSSVVVLDTKGCVSLSAEGRARLVAAMAGR